MVNMCMYVCVRMSILPCIVVTECVCACVCMCVCVRRKNLDYQFYYCECAQNYIIQSKSDNHFKSTFPIRLEDLKKKRIR